MMPSLTVSVPGKVVLAGEYTVLEGGQALGLAVTRRLSMHFSGKCADLAANQARLRSNLWSQPRILHWGDLCEDVFGRSAMAADPTAQVLGGREIEVECDFDVASGLGSSSALRLALAVGRSLLAAGVGAQVEDLLQSELWSAARGAYLNQKAEQGHGSGCDVAIQTVGGYCLFQGLAGGDGMTDAWPAQADRLTARGPGPLRADVDLFGGGAGAPTSIVLSDTWRWILGDLRRSAYLRAAQNELIAAWINYLERPGEASLGLLVGATGRLRRGFEGSPHFPVSLARVLDPIPGRDELWSYKPCGAGGEDAFLLVGPAPVRSQIEETLRESTPWRNLGLAVSDDGVKARWA